MNNMLLFVVELVSYGSLAIVTLLAMPYLLAGIAIILFVRMSAKKISKFGLNKKKQ